MKVAMIGTGYVGLVSGACFADFGHSVICVDKDASKIERLEKEIVELDEEMDEALTELNLKWKEIADGFEEISVQPYKKDVLVDIFGKHEVEWLQVVEIRPIEDNFIDRLDIYLATTFSYTKATDLGQVSLNTNISYEDERSRNTLSGRTDIVSTNDEDSRSSRYDIERWTWNKRRSDSFRSIFANYEDNDELALTRRIGAGGGVGRYWLDTHKTRFTGTIGAQVITERFSGESTNQDVELFLSTTFSTWKFTTPELDIDVNFSVYPSLTDSGRVRTDGNLRIRWELVEDLFWDVTAWTTSDNQAETDDATTDYSITTGIGWEF